MARTKPARSIRLVHSSPGRTRLRIPWLRGALGEAEALADALAGLDSSLAVEIRPWTGSVLCTYSPECLDEAKLLSTVQLKTGARRIARPGEPEKAPSQGGAAPFDPSLRHRLGRGVHKLNRDVREATEGRLDLGGVTGLGFLALGTLEIVATRKLPAPPWFTLAWWAFRTFTLFPDDEDDLEAETPEAAEAD